LYPKLCINSTLAGAQIFFVSVFPSLFPFLVICNILFFYDGINIYSRIFGKYICNPLKLSKNCSFALIVSALCGYPLGAKYTCDLYEKKMITKNECQRLLNIASNASPLFIVGSVGTAMLHSAIIGYILLLGSYISCILMGIFLPNNYKKDSITNSYIQTSPAANLNIGAVLRDSIDSAIKTSLSVGGYITLFSAFLDIIKNNAIYNIVLDNLPMYFVNKAFYNGALLGIIEITKGSYLISLSRQIDIFSVFIIGFFIGFSGLSIISQVYSFISKFPELKIETYVKRKIIQGILCGISSALIFFIYSININVQTTISSIVMPKGNGVLLISLFILLPLIFRTIKTLFHFS
jgi:sporulation integral membrane protein YlbJ